MDQEWIYETYLSFITMDRRVWKYWRIENFVGNLPFEADPVKRDNVMYSGW